ncbi:MAG: hypothetical protein ACI8RD_012389, partial [Bacillariaceae sp.]
SCGLFAVVVVVPIQSASAVYSSITVQELCMHNL